MGLLHTRTRFWMGRARYPEEAAGDFAHWEGRSTETLYSVGRTQCTNPRPDDVASAQSRRRREGHRTKSRPNVAASVQTRTLRTGRVVRQGLCTVPASTSVQTPVQTLPPVYKADDAERSGVQSPVRTGSPVYKAGVCALGGAFDRDFVQCPEATAGTLRTGRGVPEGVCTVPAGSSVQTPAQTMSLVYKAGRAHFCRKKCPSPICEPVRNGERPVRNR